MSATTINPFIATNYQLMINKIGYEPDEITEDDIKYIIDFISTNKHDPTILGIYANMMEEAYIKYRYRQRQKRNCCFRCCIII